MPSPEQPRNPDVNLSTRITFGDDGKMAQGQTSASGETAAPERRFTAPSGQDIIKTKVMEQVTVTDSEQANSVELKEQEYKYLEKAIGHAVLEVLRASDDRDEVFANIWSNTAHRETVKYLVEHGVGDRIATSDVLQKSVANWLDFAVRKKEMPARTADNQTQEPDDEDTEEYDDEEELEPAADGKKPDFETHAIVLAANLQASMQERRAKSLSKRQKKFAEKRTVAKAKYDGDDLDKELAKIDKAYNRREKARWIIGSALTGLGLFGGAYIIRHHLGGGHTGVHANQVPNGGGIKVHPPLDNLPGAPRDKLPLTPDQLPGSPTKVEQVLLDRYFNAPNTADIPVGPGGKNHINDFAPGSLGLLNGDKKLALSDIEKMLRGNSHITASYLSELGIGDAPKMPSMADMNNPSIAAQYHENLNTWMDNLKPEQRFLYTQQAMAQLNAAEFGAPVEFQSGYASWGINETGGDIFGAHQNQVFFDTVVNYQGVKFIPVKMPNGETHWLNTLCNQFSKGFPIEQVVPTAAPQQFAPAPEIPQPRAIPQQEHIINRPKPVQPTIPRPTPTPRPTSTPTPPPTPAPHPTPTSHPHPPLTPAPKIDPQQVYHNPGLPDQIRRDGLMDSGAQQPQNSLVRESPDYSLPPRTQTSTETAPGAQPSTGLFGGGQEQQSGVSTGAADSSGSSNTAGTVSDNS
ncbi:MAG: hypothetical protein JWN75_897 [Candidatus Saccharibacteria bacterium]|nr:hypothetical protein [Candidatus Saccharibacteria bacterium]